MPLRDFVNGLNKPNRLHRDIVLNTVGRDKSTAPTLYTQSAAPSSPNIVRSFRADSGIVRFTFSVSGDTHTKGYNIYRGSTDNAAIAERVDFVSQPGETRSTNLLTWDDPYPDNSKQYYYVAAVNEVGVEGARVGGRTEFLTASGRGNYIIIGAGSGDPSGTNDSSAAIAAAEASMGTTGGVILFMPGTYRIDTKLTLSKSNIVWEAYGATFKYNAASTSRLLDISGDNRTFIGATFSGNGGQPYGSLIYVDDNTENLKFIDCKFRDISATVKGVTMQNQIYACSISPYGVTNFNFDNCWFYNLTSTNTANVTGQGFIGAINFMKFDLGSPDVQNALTTAQTVITSGSITNCTFDTIKTILNTGLSDANVANYDDGDAIRLTGVGYDATGVKRINLRVENCRFTNISKRCIKASGVDGISVNNLECIADQGAYSMNAIIKLYGNSSVNQLKILCPGKPASLTRSGTTVTATVTAHGFSTGESICIIGANQNEYNGRFTITVTDPNTFTYTLVGAPATPATGTIAATKSPRLGIQAETLQNVTVTNVVMQAGGYFVDFNDTTSPAPSQRNIWISEFACDNLDNGGINTSTSNSDYAYSLTVANGFLGITSDIGEGIETPLSNSNTEGKFRLYNVEVLNGDVKIQGTDNIVDGLSVVINRKGFDGTISTRALLELGVPGANNYGVFRNIKATILSINDNYLDADRQSIVYVYGDNTTTENLTLRVPTNINTNTYAHASFSGKDCKVNGFHYFGGGYIKLGTDATTTGSTYSNFSRLGYGLSATPGFILTDADGSYCTIHDVTDFRTCANTPVDFSAGGPWTVYNVVSMSTKADPWIPDQNATVFNDHRLQNIIRKENTVTVTANGQAVTTLLGTLYLNDTTGGHTGITLTAPTQEGLYLSIIATSGTANIGVVPSTTALFRLGNPTFGVVSGTISAMLLKSSGNGLWIEIARNEIGVTGSGLVDDTAYNATTWDGVTTIAPSKNAVRDKIETLIGSSAYTQTYATADRTHDNFTSADIGAFTGGSVAFLDAAERDNIRTQFNALRADVADIKQLVNAIIDDMQTKTILT